MKALIAGLVCAVCLVVAMPAAGQQPSEADQKAMMDVWMKYSNPGPEHKWLEPVVGTWDAKVTTWMAPGAPAQQSSGTSESQWVLGGRFVEQKFRGSFMNQPFEGIGYTGYDNFKKQFVSTWMDTMGTGVMLTTGPAGSDGKTAMLSGTIDDIMTGKPANIKTTFKLIDRDHHVFEMWAPGPDGKEFKTMEIHYMRKKQS